MSEIRLGTRGSALALAQTGIVCRALEREGERVRVHVIRTTGDRIQDRPLPEIGGKGLFTHELDQALVDGRIDVAVHSLKDLPTRLPERLSLAAIPRREDARDVLVARPGAAVGLAALPPAARVGTSSLRRKALALAFRPDLRVESVRGNLDTRLRKLDAGEYDALVLAAAGLHRLGFAREAEYLEATAWLPAPGQGALGLVTRDDDAAVLDAVASLNHRPTAQAVTAERSLLAALEGGCQVPIGALGIPYDGGLRLWAIVASSDGQRLVRGDLTGLLEGAAALGRGLAGLLKRRGAGELLEGLEPSDLPALTPP